MPPTLRPLLPTPCPSCGADDFEPRVRIEADYEFLTLIPEAYARREFRMVSCRRCTLVYLNPRPDEVEIAHYYPENAYCCFTEFPPRSRFMRVLYGLMVRAKRKQLLPRLPADGVLLDFGCGNGHWLVALKQAALPGQRFIGIDPSEKPIRELREHGVEGYAGDESLLGTAVPPASVDLCLMIHVVEHVPDPRATLTRLAKVLKPGGEIHGVTPNVDAWDAKLFGQYWAGWHPPRHFVLFTRESLERFANQAGLEFVSCHYEMEGAAHWAVSLHTLLTQKLWRLRQGQYRLPIYPLILAAVIPIAILQKLISRTSVMSFVLRKPAA